MQRPGLMLCIAKVGVVWVVDVLGRACGKEVLMPAEAENTREHAVAIGSLALTVIGNVCHLLVFDFASRCFHFSCSSDSKTIEWHLNTNSPIPTFIGSISEPHALSSTQPDDIEDSATPENEFAAIDQSSSTRQIKKRGRVWGACFSPNSIYLALLVTYIRQLFHFIDHSSVIDTTPLHLSGTPWKAKNLVSWCWWIFSRRWKAGVERRVKGWQLICQIFSSTPSASNCNLKARLSVCTPTQLWLIIALSARVFAKFSFLGSFVFFPRKF